MNDFFPEGSLIHTAENKRILSDLTALERAMSEETVLEGRACLCNRDLDLIFSFHGIRAVMPKEEVLLPEEGGQIRDIAVITRVGKPCAFLIQKIQMMPEPCLLLSRKAAQEKCLREKLDLLEEGDVLPAKITHFEPFGAFCDIGCGITSLLSIDCISVSRIWHPSDRFRLGESIFCAVRARDDVILGRRGRISLTHKELLGTWMENASRFQAGQTVVGIIRSIESYGIFIELAPNLAGLAEWRGDVKVGDACSVYIKNIIPAKMKIKLVIIDSFRPAEGQIPTEYFITSGNVKNFHYPYTQPQEN